MIGRLRPPGRPSSPTGPPSPKGGREPRSKVNITIATGDYDRVRPIIDGRVKVEGCDVNFIEVGPEECFHRAENFQNFDVTGIGLSGYITGTSRG